MISMFRFLGIRFAVLILACCASVIAAANIPSEEEQKRTNKIVDELIEAETAAYKAGKKTAESYAADIDKLFQSATTAADAYVLLERLEEASLAYGNYATVNAIILKRAELFESLPAGPAFCTLYDNAFKTAKGEMLQKALKGFVSTYQAYISKKEYAICAELDKVADKHTLKINKFDDYKVYASLRETYAQIQAKSRALAAKKSAYEADTQNKIVCREYALLLIEVEQDWTQALPLLADCDDAQLQSIGKTAQMGTLDEIETIELADALSKTAESYTGALQAAFLRRALAHYKTCVPRVEGLELTNLQKRIKQVESKLTALAPVSKTPKDVAEHSDAKSMWDAIVKVTKRRGTIRDGKIAAKVKQTQNMASAFIGAVLLPDGKVLLIPCAANRLYVFDPATNALSSKASATGYKGGVLRDDGTVVLIPSSANDIAVYDPKTDKIIKQCPHNKGREAFQGGVLLADGTVFLAPYNANEMCIYSPEHNKIIKSCPMNVRLCIKSFLMPDNTVAIISRYGVIMYDPAINKQIMSVTSKECSGKIVTGALMPDGKIVCLTTAQSLVFEPSKRKFSAAKDLYNDKKNETTTFHFSRNTRLLSNGSLLIPAQTTMNEQRRGPGGGPGGGNFGGTRKQEVIIFSPSKRAITNRVELPSASRSRTATASFETPVILPSGDILLIPIEQSDDILLYRPDYTIDAHFTRDMCLSPFLNFM